jgi:2-(1,2-epoxy-1,2-dihydrophenyl)acetyl-CoA isomerase
MDFENLVYEVRDAVAYVTLDREKVANALNLALCQELEAAALAAQEDESVRAVVLGSKGKLFCAGGDISAFSAAGDAVPVLIKRMTIHLHAALSILARMDAPVIAAVGGTAAGAGFSLVCATDLAVAGESAKFTMAYTRAGLVPDGSSSYYLPRLVGTRRAAELMLTNRLLSAREALEWGIVNQVVPDGEVDAAAAKLAGQLAQGPTRAFGQVKQLLLSSGDESLETQMEFEARGIVDAARSADGREGIAAFLEKRAPRFKGGRV